MANFWRVVNDVVKQSDMILLVLDARYLSDSRNIEIEDKIISSGKLFLYVINKCDLVDKAELERKAKSISPSIYISAKDHLGTVMLRKRILQMTGSMKFDNIRIGVLGYPNVGKSSLINALKGKAAAKVSSVSGHTKNKQNVRISKNIILIDTPGVIPYLEKDAYKQAILGAVNVTSLKNPDMVLIELMERNPGMIEKMYGVATSRNKDIVLERIAKKKGALLKGGVPDIERVSRMILQDIQKHKQSK